MYTALHPNTASSIELYSRAIIKRKNSLERPFIGSVSIQFCINKAPFGSFSLIWEHCVFFLLFFSSSCNHCNIISFRTQSHPVLDARLVPSSRLAIQRQTRRAQQTRPPRVFPAHSRRVHNFYTASSHPNHRCTPPIPRGRDSPAKAAQQVPRIYLFISPSVVLAQGHLNSFDTST